MPIVGTVFPQPKDVADYDLDYSDFFPPDDTIVSVVLDCVPTMSPPPSYAIHEMKVKVWVYGGKVHKTDYKITARAITNDGREKEAELIVKCREV